MSDPCLTCHWQLKGKDHRERVMVGEGCLNRGATTPLPHIPSRHVEIILHFVQLSSLTVPFSVVLFVTICVTATVSLGFIFTINFLIYTDNNLKFLFHSHHSVCLFRHCGSYSVVGIVTAYGLDGLRVECWWRGDFPHLFRTALGSTQPPVWWIMCLSYG